MPDKKPTQPAVQAVTLKNYKPVPALSEETEAFTATIYLDRKRAGQVSNVGHGGCNRYDFTDRQAEEAFNAYVETWARENGRGGEIADALIEKLCDDIALKQQARSLVRHSPATVVLIEKKPGWFTDEHTGSPDYYNERFLIAVRGNDKPETVAAAHEAHSWRVIPVD
jgi:hypothetical protein